MATGHPGLSWAQELEEHNLMFGATLNKWLVRNLGHLKYRVGFAQKQLDWILNAFCSTRFYLLKLVFTLHLEFGKVLTEKADFGFVRFCNVMEWMLEQIKGKEQCYNYCNC